MACWCSSPRVCSDRRRWAAISTAAPTGTAGRFGWVRQYARDHTIHLVVIFLFAVYPAIFHLLTADADSTTIWLLLLPSITTMTEIFYLSVFAMSFDFISGYTGYLSFGHSLFFGTGVFFVLAGRKGMLPFVGPETGFMVLLAGAMIVAFAVAVLVGLVSFRLTGVYFAMITLGFAELVKVAMVGYIGADTSFTGTGAYGVGIPFLPEFQLELGAFGSSLALHQIPLLGSLLSLLSALPLVPATITLRPSGTTFYLVGLLVLISYFAMQRIIHSPFGRVMIAIRENESRARAVGYNTYWYKLIALAFSGAFGAVGGALAAGVNNSGNPESHFSVIQMSGDALLATIIGGMGTLAGPLYGFLFERNLAEFFGGKGTHGLIQYLDQTVAGLLDVAVAFEMTVGDYINTVLQGHSALYIGFVFIIFVLYVPGGLLGSIRLWMGGKLSKSFPAWLSRRRLFGGLF